MAEPTLTEVSETLRELKSQISSLTQRINKIESMAIYTLIILLAVIFLFILLWHPNLLYVSVPAIGLFGFVMLARYYARSI